MGAAGINLHFSAMKASPWKLGERGRVRCEPGWNLGRDWCRRLADFDLWFVWAGRGNMETTDGPLELYPGVCLWMRPGRRYEAEQDPQDRLGVNYIHFRPANGRALTPPWEVLHGRSVAYVDQVMRRIIEATGEPAASRAATLLGVLLDDLTEEHAAAGRRSGRGIARHHEEVVQRAITLLREDAASARSVAELARRSGYSGDHFARVFARVTGQTPRDYVIGLRMERARQLLAESSLSVSEVAATLGFADLFFFSRQFRRKVGCSPREFRRRLG